MEIDKNVQDNGKEFENFTRLLEKFCNEEGVFSKLLVSLFSIIHTNFSEIQTLKSKIKYLEKDRERERNSKPNV